MADVGRCSLNSDELCGQISGHAVYLESFDAQSLAPSSFVDIGRNEADDKHMWSKSAPTWPKSANVLWKLGRSQAVFGRPPPMGIVSPHTLHLALFVEVLSISSVSFATFLAFLFDSPSPRTRVRTRMGPASITDATPSRRQGGGLIELDDVWVARQTAERLDLPQVVHLGPTGDPARHKYALATSARPRAEAPGRRSVAVRPPLCGCSRIEFRPPITPMDRTTRKGSPQRTTPARFPEGGTAS